MQIEQVSVNGLTIRLLAWECESPKGVFIGVHGMGTHGGRYESIASFFQQNNYSFYSYDQPGHGHSGGQRGDIKRYRVLLETLDSLSALLKARKPEVPHFIFGHSMGANVVANYLIRFQPKFNGVILSAPWFKLAFAPPFIKMMFAKLLVCYWPNFPFSSKLNANYISHDQAILDAYAKDKLVHNYITPRFFMALRNAGLFALRNAKQLSIPLYIYQGSQDHITSLRATRKFASRVNNVEFRIWEGCYHEVHNEWVRAELFQSYLSFVEKHL